MTYTFPYTLVPVGSKIILYGVGDVGKDYYFQLRDLKDCYQLLAWTATPLDDYELNKPFDYVRNIPAYAYDYIIIAAMNKRSADEIKATLRGMNIPEKRIIWAPDYCQFGHEQFPKNMPLMLKHLDFYMDILDQRPRSRAALADTADFYQSFSALGLRGKRSSEERIVLYHIPELLTKRDTVLNVGCNCGFLDLQIAPYVKEIIGVDLDRRLLNVANRAKEFLSIQNASFYEGNFWGEECAELRARTYDAVLACAIHRWVVDSGVTPENFVEALYDVLKPEGYMFFESQDMDNGWDKERFDMMSGMFRQRGMELVLERTYASDYEREIRVFQKKG